MRYSRLCSVLALAIMPLLAGCGGGSNSAGPTAVPATGTPSAAPTSLAPSTAAPGPGCRPATTDGNGGPYPASASSDCTGKKLVEVDMVSDPQTTGGFSPSNITISAGTTVKFVWKSGGHNLSPWHAGIEDVGFTFSKTFESAGDYPYQCQVHPGQNGIIHVK